MGNFEEGEPSYTGCIHWKNPGKAELQKIKIEGKTRENKTNHDNQETTVQVINKCYKSLPQSSHMS